MSEATQLTAEETINLLKHIIANNKMLIEKNLPKSAINIEGESGIGKTSIIKSFAENIGFDFIKLNLAQLEDVGDLVGFPIREFKMQNGGWVNEKELGRAVELGEQPTGETRTGYCPPAWAPVNTESQGILFLDDWTRADTRIIQACMELVDRGEYLSWTLPKNWHVVLSSNPDDGNYFVTALDKAQKTRFSTVLMKFDVEVWARWAEKAEIDSRCINFVLLNDEFIRDGDINIRTATRFFNDICSLHPFENNYPMINLLGNASVGKEFTQSFITFVENKLDRLPSPKAIFETEKLTNILNKGILGDTKKKNQHKSSVAKVISTRILNYLDKLSTDAGRKQLPTQVIERTKEIMLSELFHEDIYLYMGKTINANTKMKSVLQDPKVRKVINLS